MALYIKPMYFVNEKIYIEYNRWFYLFISDCLLFERRSLRKVFWEEGEKGGGRGKDWEMIVVWMILLRAVFCRHEWHKTCDNWVRVH